MNKSIFYYYFKGALSVEEEKKLLDRMDENESNRNAYLKERKLLDMLLLNYSTLIKLKPNEQFTDLSLTNISQNHNVATHEYITWIDGVFASYKKINNKYIIYESLDTNLKF